MASPARIPDGIAPSACLAACVCAGSLVGIESERQLAGPHEGPVADLLAAAPDRNAVQLESEDWMLGGHAVKQKISVGVGTRPTQGDYFAGFHLAGCRTAVPRNHRFHRQCSWQSGTGHLAALPCQPFRRPGRDERGHPNQTKLPPADLIADMGSIESVHHLAVDLDLVDMEGVTSDEPNCSIPWPSARNHASVLAPWLDMDPNASLGGDPVAFLCHGTGCRTGRIAIGQLDTVEQLS